MSVKRKRRSVSVEVPSADEDSQPKIVVADDAAKAPRASQSAGLRKRTTSTGALWSGRIRPGEEVGRGATGTVMRGTDVKLRRDVAVKVTKQPRGELPTQLFARFVEEAQITAQLEHPNVVPVHDFGFDPEGRAYFSMKLVRGQSLETILAKRRAGDPATVGEFGLRRLLDVFKQVCQAMEYAHAHGVIHRDLKPANIMVGDFGEVLVMDWGIAKLMGPGERGGSAARPDASEHDARTAKTGGGAAAGDSDGVDSSSSLVGATGSGSISSDRKDARALQTQHGMVLGTPAYMSPEQARGLELDERSDIYALGVILYEILCGRVPFDSEDPMKAVSRLLVEQPKPPSSIDKTTPHMLDVLVMRLLEKDRDKRQLTLRQLRSLVDDYIEGIGQEYRQQSLWTNVLWVAGALGLFAFLVWYLTGQSVATLVALAPSAGFNALGWVLLVMAVGYPLWAAKTAFSMSTAEPGRFRAPTGAELFVSGYLAHRTFAMTIAPLFQLAFVVETFVLAFPDVSSGVLAQIRTAWANALVVIIVLLFGYLFMFSAEVRFARRIDRYVRLLRRSAWERIWPFALLVGVLFTVVATDVLDWTPSGGVAGAWAFVEDRILTPTVDGFETVKTLVFQGTFLVGLVIATVLLAFPFSELLASLRLPYQPVDQASVSSRKRYFLRSLAVLTIVRMNFLYAGAMIGSLTGLTILSGKRGSLLEQVIYVLGPSLIGVFGFALVGRQSAKHLAGAPAVRRMLDDELATARAEHTAADLHALAAASRRQRWLQLAVPVVCVLGYLVWSGSGVHQEALRALILPVSAKGFLLILPYAALVLVLLVRDPVHARLLRRREDKASERAQAGPK